VSAAIEAVLGDGRMRVVRDEAGVREGWMTIHEQTLESIAVVAGVSARDRVARDGLGVLHEVLPAEAIGELRDQVMPRVRATLFETTCRVAREVLGIDGPFYVDDYTILRVNFPYEVALRSSMDAENPGIGRMSQGVKRDAEQARVVDPVYDPKGYHAGQPPASWAHGPHLDTWTGHSRDGVNLWWAIGDVVAEHAMFFYPELHGVPLAPDPRSLYLRAGRPLPRPSPVPLAAGEMLVFDPEVLHGTHLNVSGLTRVAASTRINARRPAFDPTCFYAREFWHESGDLERGDVDTVVRFPRAEHLAAPPAAPRPGDGPPSVARVALHGATADAAAAGGAWRDVAPATALAPSGKLVVADEHGEAVWLLCRTRDAIRAVGARCPHLGTSLADGYHDDAHLHCPAHAVRFDLRDGTCASPALRLQTARTRERDGRIELRVAAST
jgi:nitrite reductase/ring-hydroxylating ferredoxin subunit